MWPRGKGDAFFLLDVKLGAHKPRKAKNHQGEGLSKSKVNASSALLLLGFCYCCFLLIFCLSRFE